MDGEKKGGEKFKLKRMEQMDLGRILEVVVRKSMVIVVVVPLVVGKVYSRGVALPLFV